MLGSGDKNNKTFLVAALLIRFTFETLLICHTLILRSGILRVMLILASLHPHIDNANMLSRFTILVQSVSEVGKCVQMLRRQTIQYVLYIHELSIQLKGDFSCKQYSMGTNVTLSQYSLSSKITAVSGKWTSSFLIGYDPDRMSDTVLGKEKTYCKIPMK